MWRHSHNEKFIFQSTQISYAILRHGLNKGLNLCLVIHLVLTSYTCPLGHLARSGHEWIETQRE